MINKARANDEAIGRMLARQGAMEGLRLRGLWHVRCIKRDGLIAWEDQSKNLVVNEGIDYLMRVGLLGSGTQTQISPWYVGLTGSSPTPAAADTMASHAGWTEIHTEYSQANRPTWSGADTGTGTVSNSASVASFSFTASATVGGCFLTSSNTKNGTTGTLYAVVAFTGGNRSVVNGDTLEVTYNFSVVDDGV